MPLAALLVHQLRYLLAFGSQAGLQVARQGHAYLHSLVPWLVLLLSLAVGGFLWALGRALAGHRSPSRYTASLLGLWAACTGCLIAIFVVQESLEGLLAVGHPAGLAGVFGYGGWWALPAAACVGLVLATIFHGARWVLDEAARLARCARRRVPRPERPLAHPAHTATARLTPLADGWSGRGPPAPRWI
jgi:hypothetical protein